MTQLDKNGQAIPECTGICECCKDEYDEPKVTPLYRVGGILRCGDCATQYEMDAMYNEMAYGSD